MTPDLAAAIRNTTLDEINSPKAYDAIVVGAGAAGGMAAALLTEAGLRVLVLDAGVSLPFWRVPVRRAISTVLTALATPEVLRVLPSSFRWRGEKAMRLAAKIRQPIQSSCYAWPSAPEGFVDDRECLYDTPEDRPFDWIRVHGLGGKVVVPLHGRQYLRHGHRDFRPVDGQSPDWPFAPDELDRWYDLVEARIGLSGRQEHSTWIPDSRLARVREPTSPEAALIDKVTRRYPRAEATLGRYAPPFASLAAAARSKKLLCRRGAVARQIETDETGRVKAVVYYDRDSQRLETARSSLIFLCTSTLETTRILLTSRSDRCPEGLGAASGALGRNLMDHVSLKAEGVGPAIEGASAPEQGQCVYFPRFDARLTGDPGSKRGFDMRVYQSAGPLGTSYFTAVTNSEMLPRTDNFVRLSSRSDAWGLPTLHISCARSAAELAIAEKQKEALREVAEIAGVTLNGPVGDPAAPGASIHECGTARMGTEPGNSVLDPHNECWDAKGLFVTDGASFPSVGLQNPALTILALTARACRHAVETR